mgnify:CR=1 FL=1
MNHTDPDPPEESIVLRGARFNVHAMSILGSDGKTYVREVVRHPGAVVILPLLDDDTLVMIENNRPTVGETLLELPAGTRELETGYQAKSVSLVHEFYSAPGISDELMLLYVARDLTRGEHAREATEQIENRIASREDVRSWIAEGRIRDAKTLVGLYAFLVGTISIEKQNSK